ncbi:MAG: hypothetical protein AAGF99_01700 [Bacteroidota bacterium]
MSPFFLNDVKRHLLLLLLVAVVAVGCDTADSDTVDPVVEVPTLAILFSSPTQAEIDAVRADLLARTTDGSYAVRNVNVEDQQTLSDGSTVFVVSHTMADTDGTDFTNFAAIRVPQGAANLPVLIINHGGDQGFSLDTELALLLGGFPSIAASTVQAWPVFRSETIRDAFGQTYTAGGAPSPWDRDVDDAITLMNAVLDTFPDETDAERLGTLGYSRGGAVSLLMAQRGVGIDAVTDYFGPTDFFDETIQLLALGALVGDEGALSLPGAIFLRDELLQPYLSGDLAEADARAEVVKRSSSLYTAFLPNTQVLHHRRDVVVPFDQAVAFDEAAQTAPPMGTYEYLPYGEAPMSDADLGVEFHSPFVMGEGGVEGFSRVAQFHARFLLAGATAAAPAF